MNFYRFAANAVSNPCTATTGSISFAQVVSDYSVPRAAPYHNSMADECATTGISNPIGFGQCEIIVPFDPLSASSLGIAVQTINHVAACDCAAA